MARHRLLQDAQRCKRPHAAAQAADRTHATVLRPNASTARVVASPARVACQSQSTLLRQGLVAGFVATVPMTLFMLAAHRTAPAAFPRPLPPERVTDRLLRKLGVHHRFGPASFHAAAAVVHFAFGAAAGGVYALGPRPAGRRPLLTALVYPLLYAQCVWAATYPSGLPLVGLYPPPRRQSPARQIVVVAAHVVWGTTLGLLFRRAGSRGHRPSLFARL